MTTTLYGAEVSYFTGKVRAYLRWAAIPFEEVLSTADVYRQVIVPAVGAPVIPVLRDGNGRILQDSTVIAVVVKTLTMDVSSKRSRSFATTMASVSVSSVVSSPRLRALSPRPVRRSLS